MAFLLFTADFYFIKGRREMRESIRKELPYVRTYVLRSVYGVLRQGGMAVAEEEPGKVIAEWKAGRTDISVSITAEETAFGTELTISLRRPCDGMPEQKVTQSLQEMMDQIVRHLGNTLITEETNEAKAK